MSLKKPKTLQKCYENLKPQIPELQFLKLLSFPRPLQKLQEYILAFFV